MNTYRVTLTGGLGETEHQANGYEVRAPGYLALLDQNGDIVMYAPHAWSVIELVKPDPFTAATQAASG